jgi:hypothetical protein
MAMAFFHVFFHDPARLHDERIRFIDRWGLGFWFRVPGFWFHANASLKGPVGAVPDHAPAKIGP